MKPIDFEGSNCVLAENQPEYLNLPVKLSEDKRTITSCWKLSFRERLKLLFGGRLFIKILTFGNPLQPQLPYVTDKKGRCVN